MSTADRARSALRDHFGFDDFKPGQEQVVTALLEGRSALAIFPTGGGKSVCYQLPALLLDGVTVVVSPLIALMKDQIDFLNRKKVPAARLDSTLSLDEYREAIHALNSGSLKLLYLAPERLANERLLTTLRRIKISLLAIDEAHCISEWGHNFRPDYMKLATLADELKVERVLGLTATATSPVAGDIARAFRVADRDIVQTGFHRPNLELRVTPASGDAKLTALVDRLRTRPPATIVYVTLQKTAESTAAFLNDQGFAARAYHAGMKDEDRHDVQDWFMSEPTPVVVATIAFGMGIDKSNIRYVYHLNLPKTLENYAQEIGRAGRDGKPAVCELFADGRDRVVLENFTYGDTPSPDAVTDLMRDVLKRGPEFDVSVYDLSQHFDIRQLVVSTLLTYLELDGVIRATGSYFSEYKFEPLRPSAEILKRFDKSRADFLASLLRRAVKARTWFTLDVAAAAEALCGQPRERLVAALNYLEEQGDLKLEIKGKRQTYRRLKSGAELKGLPEKMAERFGGRETRDIERLGTVLGYAATTGCRTAMLCNYFDESMETDCGHCDVCLGEPGGPVPDTAPTELEEHQRVTLRKVVSWDHPSLKSARQVTRYLCGLTSPAVTKEKLTQRAEFGALGEFPFQIILRAAEREIGGS